MTNLGQPIALANCTAAIGASPFILQRRYAQSCPRRSTVELWLPRAGASTPLHVGHVRRDQPQRAHHALRRKELREAQRRKQEQMRSRLSAHALTLLPCSLGSEEEDATTTGTVTRLTHGSFVGGGPERLTLTTSKPSNSARLHTAEPTKPLPPTTMTRLLPPACRGSVSAVSGVGAAAAVVDAGLAGVAPGTASSSLLL
eukprot:scaffold1691_cov378-Prasinococcus_capsulatus_cf.AAC.3